jgi:hypothetical protein
MRNSIIRIIGLAVLLAAAAIAGAQQTAPERIVVPLSNPGQPAFVKADVLFGAVKVTGYEGKDVIVEAKPRAKSLGEKEDEGDVPKAAAKIARAFSRSSQREKEKNKEEADKAAGMKQIPLNNSGLTVEEENNRVKIQVESWRAGYDFDIKVPVNTSIKISGANLDVIQIENVSGEIEVESANGEIKLINVSGTVVAQTTNGDVTAILNRIAPNKPMSFVTFNGDVDVTLPADTKATVRIKSNMGDVYSDFDVALKQTPAEMEKNPKKEGGKFRISIDRSIFGTINGGGAEFKFQNYNGNIYLRKKK